MADRGRDTSDELTEVRTVLSRAESALHRFAFLRSAREQWGGLYPVTDPDEQEMEAALNEVVSLLDRWRRTGRSHRV